MEDQDFAHGIAGKDYVGTYDNYMLDQDLDSWNWVLAGPVILLGGTRNVCLGGAC